MKKAIPIISIMIILLVIASAVATFAFFNNKDSTFTLEIATENHFVIAIDELTTLGNVEGNLTAVASAGDNSGTFVTEHSTIEDHPVITITIPCKLSLPPIAGYQSTIMVSNISIWNRELVGDSQYQVNESGYMAHAFEYKIEPLAEFSDKIVGGDWALIGEGGAIVHDNQFSQNDEFTVKLLLRLILSDDLIPHTIAEKNLATRITVSVGLQEIQSNDADSEIVKEVTE